MCRGRRRTADRIVVVVAEVRIDLCPSTRFPTDPPFRHLVDRAVGTERSARARPGSRPQRLKGSDAACRRPARPSTPGPSPNGSRCAGASRSGASAALRSSRPSRIDCRTGRAPPHGPSPAPSDSRARSPCHRPAPARPTSQHPAPGVRLPRRCPSERSCFSSRAITNASTSASVPAGASAATVVGAWGSHGGSRLWSP